MAAEARRRVSLACLFGLHNDVPLPATGKWVARCAACGRETDGVPVPARAKRGTRPTTRQGRKRFAQLRERYGVRGRGRKDKAGAA